MTSLLGIGTARLWSVKAGMELSMLGGHEGVGSEPERAAWTARQVVTGREATARIWMVNFSDVLELAESRLPVTLRPEARAQMLER